MKRVLSCAVCGAVIAFGLGSSHAGSIDYLTNQSADYIRTFSRNAATDSADAVTFNPAGTAFFADDGLYVSFSAQTILKFYSISFDETEGTFKDYPANTPTPFLPSFFAVYKWKHLAGYAGFSVPAGGGTLKYDEGVPYLLPLRLFVKDALFGKLESGSFEGSSMYLGPIFGAAYELFGMVSIAASGRVILADKEYKGQGTYVVGSGDNEQKITGTLDTGKSAQGFGGIFGIHIRPLKGLNLGTLDIGIRYEMEVPLEFEASTTSTNLNLQDGTPLASFMDGAKEKRNLPAVLGIGIAYEYWKLQFSASWTYYFIKAADKDPDNTEASAPYAVGYDDDYDNGMDIAVSVGFKITDNLLASVGFNRAISGANKDTYTDFEHALSSNSIGGGVRYTLMDSRLDITGAISGTFYEDGQNIMLNGTMYPRPETFKKTAMVFSLGGQYRFF